ncbi:CvpA family protein [Sandaracinobacter sp. RS1-74]|uniref:CvpA family protein n=1 Tax=Sandaracinobacteroides sayramensis TaxID=2913411 RepID=UPI001EDA188E|nr:CvpA family protein [Sandaracinobacteroides sayramensis]MCG2841719.1 CvpA family protein [Sandaracinobacteroides sayramensis]
MDILSTFTAFDWVVVSLIGFLAIGGLMRGFTHEALSLAGWILAIVAVRLFHQQATMWLLPKTGGESTAAIVAFIGLFFGTALLARIAAGAAGGFARRSLLGPMDRVLGLGFGALKGLILASALFLLTQFATGLFDAEQEPPEWLRESRSAPILSLSANAMVGWVKEWDAKTGDKGGEATRGLGLPPGVQLPPGALPPGHPEIPPPYAGPVPPGRNEGGYTPEDRRALDELLNEGAKSGEQVNI